MYKNEEAVKYIMQEMANASSSESVRQVEFGQALDSLCNYFPFNQNPFFKWPERSNGKEIIVPDIAHKNINGLRYVSIYPRLYSPGYRKLNSNILQWVFKFQEGHSGLWNFKKFLCDSLQIKNNHFVDKIVVAERVYYLPLSLPSGEMNLVLAMKRGFGQAGLHLVTKNLEFLKSKTAEFDLKWSDVNNNFWNGF